MSAASEILDRIEDDSVFKGFLEPGFDPAAFASRIVKADVGKAGGAAPSVLLQGDGAALTAPGVGVGVGNQQVVMPSAESVSSQAEITLDVRCHPADVECPLRVVLAHITHCSGGAIAVFPHLSVLWLGTPLGHLPKRQADS